MDLVRASLTEKLRLHPRIAQQKELVLDAPARERLAAAVPPLVPFRGRALVDVIAILDWDHRLPSKKFTLRLHACYSEAGVQRLEAAIADRLAEIRARDLFPEFDVPDMADLPGDESYDLDVTAELTVDNMRFVSPWRRELPGDIAEQAQKIVRNSVEFSQARATEPARPSHLGDAEAVSWSAPCESSHEHWTIDVWWLTAFDGKHGRGWSFLVDLDVTPPKIVTHREFTVRTG